MTLKDILEGYGIDFSTLKFQLRKDIELDNLTIQEVKDQLADDEIIVDGSFICDFDTYEGCLELYWGDDMVNAAEGACARLG